jgi:uncharacterized protein (DUF342 family)
VNTVHDRSPLPEGRNDDVNLEKYVSLSVSPLSAAITVSSSCLADAIKPDEGSLLSYLEKKGISHGIKKDALHGILQNRLYDTDVVVAEGTGPLAGKDGSIAYEIDFAKNLRPSLRKDSTVDFRDVQSIKLVTAGQRLATRTPPAPGIDGKTVTGERIAAPAGNDVKLPAGKNTTVSEDGIFLLSAKNGSVSFDGVLVHVTDMLEVASDINFSVGNIKYSGDVIIKGSVLPGFAVEAEGSVVVRGDVDSARIISRNGTVTLEKGLIGKGDAYVYGKQGVHVAFAQEAIIVTDGSLTVDKYCLNCDVTCEALAAGQPRAGLLGGHAKVFSSVDVAFIGNDKGIKTLVSVIDKEGEAKNKKVAELKTLEKDLARQLEPVKTQLSSKAAIFKSAGDTVTDRHKAELKKWLDTYNEMATKIKYVRTSIAETKGSLAAPKNHGGYVRAAETIFPGTEINYFGISAIIKVRMQGKKLVLKNGAITEG